MFFPTTIDEQKKFGWDTLDIILITGDTYIDSPYIGISVIANVLFANGFRVGIIAQPDINDGKDIKRLGEPKLFWAVSAGSIDSMVANYTALKKKRRSDDNTPGGENNRRPDRATIIYSNLIRKYFKNTKPIVLGGLEASLRRIAHYDYWDDKVRRSILFDSKANYLIYGMGEKAVIELSNKLKKGEDVKDVKGLCYIDNEPRKDYVALPDYEVVKSDKNEFIDMFNIFYKNNEPGTSKGLCQKNDTRYLIQNPPADYPNTKELDSYFDLKYERDLHPYYKKIGNVKALETIKFSIITHRGCYGECNFCSISVHQGVRVISRSERSIIEEAKAIIKLPDFKGYIPDVGGPTANMYGFECNKKILYGMCDKKICIYPSICKQLPVNHKRQIDLLRKIRNLDKVKKVFVASGLRYDMILKDDLSGEKYLDELIEHHTSGQLKIAPEHSERKVLNLMRKMKPEDLERFKDNFYTTTKRKNKNQFLTYYFIAAHPGCDYNDMVKLKKYIEREKIATPEQIQIFTPTPSTYSTLMYYTEMDPFTKEKIFVEKSLSNKRKQKEVLMNGKK